jgi:ribosomal protein S12 methylthiotransferase accessory factor YcaO
MDLLEDIRPCTLDRSQSETITAVLGRSESRAISAALLNAYPIDDLFDWFQITRVANITGLDHIGVPVYCVHRPASKTVSVNCGKSIYPLLARAGAIAEGIECSIFENPNTPIRIGRCEPFAYPVAKGKCWELSDKVPIERVTHYQSGKEIDIPSDLVWIDARERKCVLRFQSSSNGQALGLTFDDAFLAGLYETIERNAATSWALLWEAGHAPQRSTLPHASYVRAVAKAGLQLFLFYIPHTVNVPVYWALLVDPSGGHGAFAGWGCDLNSGVAAERAILEAIQSRCVYIAGARDDIERRDYKLMRERDPQELIAFCDQVPISHVVGFGAITRTLHEEITQVTHRLGDWVTRVYFKHIPIPQIELHAVKTIILGFQGPRTPLWQPI